MDDSEHAAYDYFTHLGFKKIDYQPEGESKLPIFSSKKEGIRGVAWVSNGALSPAVSGERLGQIRIVENSQRRLAERGTCLA